MKQAFINVIRDEHQKLAQELDHEQRRPQPDRSKMHGLQEEIKDLNRQLEWLEDR